MRIFVALDIPEAVRSSVDAFIERVRPLVPQARWMRIEGAHVTLKFIGEVPPEKIEAIHAALARISLSATIPIAFRGLGFFPNEKRPRVFWAGIEGGAHLATLAAAVETSLEPLGIPRESRAFSPHLTLARFEGSARLSPLHELIASQGPFEFGGMTCGEFHLYRSVLKHGGSEYTRLFSYPIVRSAQ